MTSNPPPPPSYIFYTGILNNNNWICNQIDVYEITIYQILKNLIIELNSRGRDDVHPLSLQSQALIEMLGNEVIEDAQHHYC